MRSAMPQRRRCSQVRVLARLVVGKSTLPSPCSMIRHRIPRQANSMANARPTGPAPAMRTGTRTDAVVSFITGLLSNRPVHETEIEDLARLDFFAGCAKAFLSEIDGALHPGFVG